MALDGERGKQEEEKKKKKKKKKRKKKEQGLRRAASEGRDAARTTPRSGRAAGGSRTRGRTRGAAAPHHRAPHHGAQAASAGLRGVHRGAARGHHARRVLLSLRFGRVWGERRLAPTAGRRASPARGGNESLPGPARRNHHAGGTPRSLRQAEAECGDPVRPAAVWGGARAVAAVRDAAAPVRPPLPLHYNLMLTAFMENFTSPARSTRERPERHSLRRAARPAWRSRRCR